MHVFSILGLCIASELYCQLTTGGGDGQVGQGINTILFEQLNKLFIHVPYSDYSI